MWTRPYCYMIRSRIIWAHLHYPDDLNLKSQFIPLLIIVTGNCRDIDRWNARMEVTISRIMVQGSNPRADIACCYVWALISRWFPGHLKLGQTHFDLLTSWTLIRCWIHSPFHATILYDHPMIHSSIQRLRRLIWSISNRGNTFDDVMAHLPTREAPVKLSE